MNKTLTAQILTTRLRILQFFLIVLTLFMQTGPPLYLNSTLEEAFQYQLTIVTGVWKNSGTDANVTIVIHGSDTESQPIILNRDMMESRRILARGNEDQFVIHLPAALGEVQYVRLWHCLLYTSPSPRDA